MLCRGRATVFAVRICKSADYWAMRKIKIRFNF
jgi:hypothetical protein